MPQNRDIDGIKGNKIFTGLKESVAASIYNNKNFIEASEGDIIYQTGEESDHTYLVVRGEVRIKYTGSNLISSKVYKDFFGEREVVEGMRRITSAVAFNRCILYKIDKPILIGLAAKYPEVKNNINKFGESKTPESTFGARKLIDIAKISKPVSFRAVKKKESVIEEKTDANISDEYSIPFTPNIPDDHSSVVENKEEDKLKERLKEELLEDGENPANWQFEESKNGLKDQPVENSDEPSNSSVPEINAEDKTGQPVETKVDKIFDRENIRRVLGAIQTMHSGLSLVQTAQSISKGLRDLTVSQNVVVFLIDEQLQEMYRINTEDDAEDKTTLFKLPDGLTGTCALQKKVINFERPTEDTRFVSNIDQPGTSGLKRIMYFPVINDSGDTIAVIQLARENKKYDNDDIANLNMLSKLIGGALDRSIEFEELMHSQQLGAGKIIEDLILSDIDPPIKIINNYTELLSDKKLPEEVDEVIRMLHKQVNSVDDIVKTIFSSNEKELKLDLNEVHFNELIDDVLELLSEYCDSRQVKLYKKIGDGAVVKIDRGKFYTAIFQLMKIACNNSKTNGKIYFGSELADNKIQLTIKDEGKELGKDLQERFFKKSHELKNESIEGYAISIAKNIIEAHSGDLSFESTKSDGTTFFINLEISSALPHG